MTHTPTPWTRQEFSAHQDEIIGSDGHVVGTVFVRETKGILRVEQEIVTSEQGEADMALLLAAPKLLQSLKDLCGLAAKRPGDLYEYQAAVEGARAVIAEATKTNRR